MPNTNCSVKMSTNSITGKRKYFAYVTAPEHVTTSSFEWRVSVFGEYGDCDVTNTVTL